MVSQGYDGASAMSGQCSGVQKRIRELAPHAIYIHCYAHTLNLVLVDSVKTVPYATEFFALLETLYVFISTTKAHAIFMQKQSEMHSDKQPLQLQKLSDTRWACRYTAVNVLCHTYDCVLATLEEIGDGNDRTKAIEAKGLYCQVATFSFILSLIMFDKILSCTKSLSDQLQSINIDLAQAADLVIATKSLLEEYRDDTMWSKFYQYAVSVAELHSIEPSLPVKTRQKRLPKRFEDGVILDSIGSREPVSCDQEYKVTIFFPVLDAIIAEISRRFDQKNIEIMHAIQACSPTSENFLSPSALQPLIELYGVDKESVDMEAKLARRTLGQKENLEHISDVFKALIPLKDAFPELVKLVRIAMTIAVNTAHCERSFSALKRIKTYLRSTMCEQRLTDLAILSVEREISGTLSLDEAIDRFAGVDQNRRMLL